MDIFMGLLLILLGITIAFLGIQVFFTLLPILGFLTGFFVGAIGVHAILGDGFLGTVAGWIGGLVVGVVFAAISWFWWYAGVIVSAGAAGALLATTIAEAIGISSGWAQFVFGAVGAAAVVFLSLAVNLPIYTVIVNTSIVGASVFVNGIMLLFGQIGYKELDDGFAVATVEASWWWVAAWAVVAAVGIGRQLALKDRVRVPTERWTQVGTATA